MFQFNTASKPTSAIKSRRDPASQAFDQAVAALDKSDNPRLAALYGAKAGLTTYNYLNVVNDPKAAVKPVLVKATASIGAGSSQSDASSSAAVTQGSSISAGNKVTLVATGNGDKDATGLAADGNITARGTQISGKDITLAATRDIHLQSAEDSISNRKKHQQQRQCRRRLCRRRRPKRLHAGTRRQRGQRPRLWLQYMSSRP